MAATRCCRYSINGTTLNERDSESIPCTISSLWLISHSYYLHHVLFCALLKFCLKLLVCLCYMNFKASVSCRDYNIWCSKNRHANEKYSVNYFGNINMYISSITLMSSRGVLHLIDIQWFTINSVHPFSGHLPQCWLISLPWNQCYCQRACHEGDLHKYTRFKDTTKTSKQIRLVKLEGV